MSTLFLKKFWWRWGDSNSRPNIVCLFFYTLRLTSHGTTGIAGTACPLYLKPRCPARTTAFLGANANAI